MNITFAGKTVVVTGAAGGFGAATAKAFGAAGANVVVSDINLEGAQAVAAEIGTAIAVRTDVTEPAQLEALMEAAADAFGGIDVLVNNAGAPSLAGPLADMDVDKVRWLTAINYESTVFASKYAIPYLNQRPGASIINVASVSARRPRPGHAVYCSTKAGVETFTRALATELAPAVRVNAVNPVISETGFVKNAMGTDKLADDVREAMVAGIPMGRTAQPEDIAHNIMYLASDIAGFLTGVVLDVDGGRSI